MKHTIHIRDELVLEAQLDADEPHNRRARRCAGVSWRGALDSMAAEMAGVMMGDDPRETGS